MIANWPEGVVRRKDKGVYGLSADEADKLYCALSSDKDEQQLRFVRRGVESMDDDNAAIPLPTTSGSNTSQDVDRSSMQMKFKVTTAEGYGRHSHKRRRLD